MLVLTSRRGTKERKCSGKCACSEMYERKADNRHKYTTIVAFETDYSTFYQFRFVGPDTNSPVPEAEGLASII